MRVTVFCLFLIPRLVMAQTVEPVLPFGAADVPRIRQEIFDAVFGNEQIPAFVVMRKNLDRGSISSTYSVPHLGGIIKGNVKMKHGFTSRIYILKPAVDNGLNIPVIYHSGHGFGVFREDELVNYNNGRNWAVRTMDFFLSKGFTVVGIDMPFFGENTWPSTVIENGLTHSINSHDDIFNLKNPLYYFLAPVKSAIDYLQERDGINEFVMFGLSGGGWTTTVYSAMDDRIKLSFPVAGSIPIPLRTQERDKGDMEQYYEPFYSRFNYTTLYTLGAAGEGRQHYQILNKYDDCCFAFDGNKYWADAVKTAIEQRNLGGNFHFYLDTFSTNHRISAVAVDSIQQQVIRFAGLKRFENLLEIRYDKPKSFVCDNNPLRIYTNDSSATGAEWYVNGELIPDSSGVSLVVSDTGTYYAKVFNLSGMSFISDSIRVSQSVFLQRPVITQVGDKLYSSADNANEWYRNGVRLLGENLHFIHDPIPGRYTARTASPPCYSDMSEPFDVGITVFPNPATNYLQVRMPSTAGIIAYSLKTLQGVTVASGNLNPYGTIFLKNKPVSGVYLLWLSGGNNLSAVQKVLIR